MIRWKYEQQKQHIDEDSIFVYTLSDPVTGEVCYLGITDDPARRMNQHCSNPGRHQGNVNMTWWISSLHDIGMTPEMTIISVLHGNRSDAKSEERELIKEYWQNGHPLLNKERWMTSRRHAENWRRRLMGARWYHSRCANRFSIA